MFVPTGAVLYPQSQPEPSHIRYWSPLRPPNLHIRRVRGLRTRLPPQQDHIARGKDIQQRVLDIRDDGARVARALEDGRQLRPIVVDGARHAEGSALVEVGEIGSEGARYERDAGPLSRLVGLKGGHVAQGNVRGFSDVQAIRVCGAGTLALAEMGEKGDGEEYGRLKPHFDRVVEWITFVPTLDWAKEQYI